LASNYAPRHIVGVSDVSSGAPIVTVNRRSDNVAPNG